MGGRIFDVVDGTTRDNGALVVKDGVIQAVLAPGDQIPEVGTRVDARGATLVPGLWESHGHLVEEDENGNLGLITRAWEFHRGLPYKRKAFLERGITTVRDPGGSIDSLKARDHDYAGPHIYAAGKLFTAPGGYPVHGVPLYLHERSVFQVDDEEEARAAVQTAATEFDGVDFVKVVYTSGVLKDGEYDADDPIVDTLPAQWFDEVPLMDEAVLRAVVDEAHQLGAQVSTHTDRYDEAIVAIAAGVDYIHHAWPIPEGTEGDEFLADLAAREVCWNPTLSVFATRAPAMSPPRIDAVRRAYAAGVRITAGSDTGSLGAESPFGESLLDEMRLLVDAGLSVTDAWRAATITAAQCLGKDDVSGSLDSGKDADVVLVDGDPTVDLGLLSKENVRGVWVSGERLVWRE